MRPAVFLDRDGTIVHDVGYLSRLDDLVWYPFAIDAIRLLNRSGLLVFVVTNQGGVGLGYYPEAFVRTTHQRMGEHLEQAGAHVDAWYYCPHHPRARIDEFRVACSCRKPGTGMVEAADGQFAIDHARSFVVGDKMTDVELARAAGMRGLLVRTGQGEAELARATPPPATVVANLMEATAWILGATGHPREAR